jgi:hypothetical protein
VRTRSTILFGITIGLALASFVRAETFVFATPTDDRWHYPFNFTPGSRLNATTFGAPGIPTFNDRDGCMIIAWDTSTQIAPGQGPDAYAIDSIRVTLKNLSTANWQIDMSVDEWFTYDVNNDGQRNGDGLPRNDPNDNDGESDDDDAGRPIELFGVGFGPFTSAATWTEFAPYEGSANDGDFPRDPFPFVFRDGTGEILHVEDNVKGLHNEPILPDGTGFTPTPWAIGVPVDYVPVSQPTPFDVVFDIDLDLFDGDARRHFQEQLDAGRVFVMVTSLTEVAVMGDPVNVPNFFTKEAVGVLSGAAAPRLEITFSDALVGDLDGDGDVDLSDFALFGQCFGGANNPPAGSCAPGVDADLDGDTDVDLTDFAVFAQNFTGSQ